MDEFDANTTPSEEINETQHPAGSSRRSFLKAAVVGSAAAVAASGVGAAALTLTGHHTGLKKYVPFIGATLTGVTGDGCTTNTSGTIVDQTSYNHQESIFFWAQFKNVPSGDYVIDVAPTLSATTGDVTYQNANGNNVDLYEGSFSFACHPSSLTLTATASQSALPISFHLNSTTDVLIQVHLQGNNQSHTTDANVTLTATLYSPTESSANVVDTASASFTVQHI